MKMQFLDSYGNQISNDAVIGLLNDDILVEKVTPENIEDHLFDITQEIKEGENSSLCIDSRSKVISLVVKMNDKEYCNIAWVDEEYDRFVETIKKIAI